MFPIPRATHALRGPAGGTEGLVLVGHGSQCLQSAREMQELAELVSASLPELVVGVGYLELADPPAGAVVDAMVARGCRRVVVLPLVLLAAGHAKSDVPAIIVESRRRWPGVDFRFARPLGVSREPVELLGKSVVSSGGAGLPLLVVARGSSDPDANSDAYKAARLLAEWCGAPFVHVGFSGITGPSVSEAADAFVRLGYERFVVAWWFLCHGRLIERGRAELAELCRPAGVELVDAGHLGPHPGLVPLLEARYREALAGPVVVNCDTCAYRAPWPGLEQRVAQPIGVGHSHLAAQHARRR